MGHLEIEGRTAMASSVTSSRPVDAARRGRRSGRAVRVRKARCAEQPVQVVRQPPVHGIGMGAGRRVQNRQRFQRLGGSAAQRMGYGVKRRRQRAQIAPEVPQRREMRPRPTLGQRLGRQRLQVEGGGCAHHRHLRGLDRYSGLLRRGGEAVGPGRGAARQHLAQGKATGSGARNVSRRRASVTGRIAHAAGAQVSSGSRRMGSPNRVAGRG